MMLRDLQKDVPILVQLILDNFPKTLYWCHGMRNNRIFGDQDFASLSSIGDSRNFQFADISDLPLRSKDWICVLNTRTLLDRSYRPEPRDCKIVGNNGLVVGDWWPLRICATRLSCYYCSLRLFRYKSIKTTSNATLALWSQGLFLFFKTGSITRFGQLTKPKDYQAEFREKIRERAQKHRDLTVWRHHGTQ